MAMSVSRELKRRVGRYEPCLPRLAKEPPAGPGWIHEIKHDGFRILAELSAGGVKLITRKGFDLASAVPAGSRRHRCATGALVHRRRRGHRLRCQRPLRI